MLRNKWFALLLILAGCADLSAETPYCRQDQVKDKKDDDDKDGDADDKKEDTMDKPWFVGSLIAPTPTAVSVGHVSITPYIDDTKTTGFYDSHWKSHSTPTFSSVNYLFFTQIGMTERVDLMIVPQAFSNTFRGKHAFTMGDLTVGFDYQAILLDVDNWYPGIMLSCYEIFPIGKFDQLEPDKGGIDDGGKGAFGTVFQATIRKLYRVAKGRFLAINFATNYTFYNDVSVDGLNAFGGGFGTMGVVSPGALLNLFLSSEYNLSRYWVFSIDLVYQHKNRDHFRGIAGFNPNGTPAIVGSPSSEQFSIAPALELNLNESVGVVIGYWTTLFGRNSSRFGAIAADMVLTY